MMFLESYGFARILKAILLLTLRESFGVMGVLRNDVVAIQFRGPRW